MDQIAGPFHGELKDFKLEAFLTVAEELARGDDVERALWVLNNLPGFYRENQPHEVIKLRNELTAKIATPAWYAHNDNTDVPPHPDVFKGYLRGHLLLSEIKYMNQDDYVPHIVDVGPGVFELPLMLKHHNCKFTYEPVFLQKEYFERIKPQIEAYLKPCPVDQPRVYVACEIIEHLWNEHEIKTEMLRAGPLADVVHVSTPLYSICGTYRNWREIQTLAHLRTYTTKEFQNLMLKMFPEYGLHYIHGPIQHARLTLNGCRFDLRSTEDVYELGR